MQCSKPRRYSITSSARALEIGEAGGAAVLVELVGRDRRVALDEGGNDPAPALVFLY